MENDDTAHGLGEADWSELVRQLRRGTCVPFLGAGACAEYLPSGGQMSRAWADEYGYPLDDSHDLARVMQYVTTMHVKDATSLKERLADELFAHAEPPNFSDDTQIHSALARFDLPIYVTTNYDDFMERALGHRGKEPYRALSPWYSTAGDSANPVNVASREPTAREPVVFHLHGHHTIPASMVLTEDDYIEYLVRLAADPYRSAETSLLPPDVLAALRARPLLFVGYSLQDWTFRVLFRTLMQGVAVGQRRRHVSVQLDPVANSGATTAVARRYLDEYFATQNIRIFWGTTREFTRDLLERTSDGYGGAA